jgi:hypothetical protein
VLRNRKHIRQQHDKNALHLSRGRPDRIFRNIFCRNILSVVRRYDNGDRIDSGIRAGFGPHIHLNNTLWQRAGRLCRPATEAVQNRRLLQYGVVLRGYGVHDKSGLCEFIRLFVVLVLHDRKCGRKAQNKTELQHTRVLSYSILGNIQCIRYRHKRWRLYRRIYRKLPVLRKC